MKKEGNLIRTKIDPIYLMILYITCNKTPIGCRPHIVLLYFLRYSVNIAGFKVSIISMP